MLPLPESTFGRYHLLEQIAAGPRGALYRAEERPGGREVALKIFSLGADDEVTRAHVARFFRDVEIASSLSHPAVARIYDSGELDGFIFVCTELCEGPTLAPLLRRSERPPFEKAVQLIVEAARAMDLAHHRELFHRNLKPSNLIFHEGALKIVDFGVLHLEEARPVECDGAADVMRYRAPEQLRGQPVDGRTDEFTLGVLFYQLITGVYPFPGKAGGAQPNRERPSPPRWWNPALPPEIDPICARVLSRDPAERYPSCLAFAHALEHMLTRQSRKGQFITPAELPQTHETAARLELTGLTGLAQMPPPRRDTPSSIGELIDPRKQRPHAAASQLETYVAAEAGGAIAGILVEDPDDTAEEEEEADEIAVSDETDSRDWQPDTAALTRLPHTARAARIPLDAAPPPVDETALSSSRGSDLGVPWDSDNDAVEPPEDVRATATYSRSPQARPASRAPLPLAPGAYHPPQALPTPEPMHRADSHGDTLTYGRYLPPSTTEPLKPPVMRASTAPGPFLQPNMLAPGEDPELAALIAANQQGAAPRIRPPMELDDMPVPPPAERSVLRKVGFAVLSAVIAAAVLHFFNPASGSDMGWLLGDSEQSGPASSEQALPIRDLHQTTTETGLEGLSPSVPASGVSPVGAPLPGDEAQMPREAFPAKGDAPGTRDPVPTTPSSGSPNSAPSPAGSRAAPEPRATSVSPASAPPDTTAYRDPMH